MKKSKNQPTIRQILLGMEQLVEDLRDRLGRAEVPHWEDKRRKEQNDSLFLAYPEVIKLWRGLRYVQAKVGRIGREKGSRTKLSSEMIQRIKTNGRRRVTALAKELGISRQTIYTVLGN